MIPVKSKIETDYIFARIEYETEEGQAFMQKHGLRGFPNLLTLDSNGDKLKNLPRTFDPSEFLKAL
jgi:thioredoxin-related protein